MKIRTHLWNTTAQSELANTFLYFLSHACPIGMYFYFLNESCFTILPLSFVWATMHFLMRISLILIRELRFLSFSFIIILTEFIFPSGIFRNFASSQNNGWMSRDLSDHRCSQTKLWFEYRSACCECYCEPLHFHHFCPTSYTGCCSFHVCN